MVNRRRTYVRPHHGQWRNQSAQSSCNTRQRTQMTNGYGHAQIGRGTRTSSSTASRSGPNIPSPKAPGSTDPVVHPAREHKKQRERYDLLRQTICSLEKTSIPCKTRKKKNAPSSRCSMQNVVGAPEVPTRMLSNRCTERVPQGNEHFLPIIIPTSNTFRRRMQ